MRKDKLIHNLIYNKKGVLKKNSLAIILAVILFSFIGIFFFMNYLSAFAGGDGSSGNPYQISSCSELQNIETDLSANYILINSINCSETKTWDGGEGFRPIGNSSGGQQFNGVLNGGGYNITDLYINRSDENYVGLFSAFLSSAEVKNITLINVNITGNVSVGGLLGGDVSGGKIIDSSASGSVSGYRFVGGMVGGGNVGNAASTISRSYSEVNVTGTGNNYIGGLVGILLDGEIENSYARGNVSGNLAVGGLSGAVGGQITHSYATGKVTGNGHVGGLNGQDLWPVIINSFWDINTTGQDSSGGGGTGKTTSEMKTQSTFTDAGWDFDNYWVMDSEINAGYPYLLIRLFAGGDGSSGNPYQISSCSELQNIETDLSANYILINSINCSETKTWDGGEGFRPIGNPLIYGKEFTGTFDGNGYTISDLFITRPTTDYVGLFGYLNSDSEIKDVGLINVNITGNGYGGGLVGGIWGGAIYNSSASGSVSGGSYVGGLVGYIVDNGTIEKSYSDAVITGEQNYTGGLVGYMGNSIISDSYAIGGVTRSGYGGTYIGGLVGVISGGAIYSSYSNSSVFANGDYGGGLVGVNVQGGQIINSYATGTVHVKNFVGGLVGANWQGGKIINSYATGKVGTGYLDVGGLVGWNNGTISNSYATGDVYSIQDRAGGLVGRNLENGVINNSYARGNVPHSGGTVSGDRKGGLVGTNTQGKIINSYATGGVWGGSRGDAITGGLVAEKTTGGNYEDTNNYWDNQTSGQSTSVMGSGRLTTSMTHPYDSATTYIDWDFDNVWDEDDTGLINDGYPYLRIIPIIISVTKPQEGNTYSTNSSVPLTFSLFTLYGEDTCWYNVFNSTKNQVIANTTIANCLSTTFALPGDDVDYNITIYANDTYGNMESKKVGFGIRTNKPAIALAYPSNYLNLSSGTGIYFNYTATDSDGLDTCQLWGGWGGWSKKYTWVGPTSGVMNYTPLNVPEGNNHKWNVWCNDTTGLGDFAIINRTLTIDLTNPIMDITSPTNSTTMPTDQLTVTVDYGASDLNLEKCYFTLRTTGGLLHNYHENTTISCLTGTKIINTYYYGTFVLQLWAEDYAGNLGSDSVTWTSVSSGGGGSGGTTPGEPTLIEVIVNETKTYCGDGICQTDGNDFGVQENFFNCPQDCEGFDLDTFIFSFTKYCFDNDPSTVCLMPLFSVLPAGQSNVEPTKTTTTISVGVGLLILLIILSFVKVEGPGGKKVTGYNYIKLKLKKRRR